MWLGLFCFPSDVADALTLLTTYNGFVAQGAPTSVDIGNLVLWQVEPNFVNALAQRGFTFTRYIDDIAISGNRHKNDGTWKQVRDEVHDMLASVGLKPNLQKESLKARNERMTMHRLNIAAGRVTKSKGIRKELRAAVFECERRYSIDDPNSLEYRALFNRTMGRVSEMARLHESADRLLERLHAVRPPKG
jgi:hypothetical protein